MLPDWILGEGIMTELLARAFEKASTLPEHEQNELGAMLLDAIDCERQWEAVLAKDPTKLERMVNKALEDVRAGRSEPLDPEKL
jgi:hypothetical protein